MDPTRDRLPIKLIVYIYETTPEKDRGLKDITVEWYLRRMPRVMFVEGESIVEATVQVPTFASDVIMQIGRKAKFCAFCGGLLSARDTWGENCCDCGCPKRYRDSHRDHVASRWGD